MKKRVWVISMAFCCLVSAWAGQPQAILQSVKGKVEVRAPGMSAWVPATEGQVLDLSATLSTGFDSSVVVVIDKTTLQVKPLTRMAIDKLAADGDTVKTTTFLRVGSVSASVKSPEGVKQDFKVQSPYSTASVRGTVFDFDGITLAVHEGTVALFLGRPQREVTDPSLTSDEDFTGSPDTPLNESTGVLVPAGRDAQVVLDYQNETARSQGSRDRQSLMEGTGLPPPSSTPVPPSAPQRTGLKLTIEFVD